MRNFDDVEDCLAIMEKTRKRYKDQIVSAKRDIEVKKELIGKLDKQILQARRVKR